MRIVVLGSVALPVPPPKQGGTERIAYHQARGLAARGHEITLVAAQGSRKGSYKLVEIGGGDTVEGAEHKASTIPLITEGSRKLRKEAVYLAEVGQWLMDNHRSYDLILNNMRAGEAFFLPIAKKLNKPCVNVMHLPLFDTLCALFDTYNTPVITISEAQRKACKNTRYIGTVHNAIEVDRFTFQKNQGEYLLMLGSIAPHKNQKAGIEVAKHLDMPLVLAGKIGNQEYYKKEVAPHLDRVKIQHVGEIGFESKVELYGGAYALLFPIIWPEPFGLVMIEAMACGTPVVAYDNGAISEVVKDGVTGFIVPEEEGAYGLTEAVKQVETLDRAVCRSHVEEHYTIDRMIDELEHALQKVQKL